MLSQSLPLPPTEAGWAGRPPGRGLAPPPATVPDLQPLSRDGTRHQLVRTGGPHPPQTLSRCRTTPPLSCAPTTSPRSAVKRAPLPRPDRCPVFGPPGVPRPRGSGTGVKGGATAESAEPTRPKGAPLTPVPDLPPSDGPGGRRCLLRYWATRTPPRPAPTPSTPGGRASVSIARGFRDLRGAWALLIVYGVLGVLVLVALRFKTAPVRAAWAVRREELARRASPRVARWLRRRWVFTSTVLTVVAVGWVVYRVTG